MVEGIAPAGTIMVTWANFHYLDFTMNWVHHVQAANISAYLVGAMDDELLQALLERGVNCFAMQSGLSTGDFGWGSQQFHKMVSWTQYVAPHGQIVMLAFVCNFSALDP